MANVNTVRNVDRHVLTDLDTSIQNHAYVMIILATLYIYKINTTHIVTHTQYTIVLLTLLCHLHFSNFSILV